MEIMSLAIAVFAVIIGLVIGYVSISAKMKSSQEAAELIHLNKKNKVFLIERKTLMRVKSN